MSWASIFSQIWSNMNLYIFGSPLITGLFVLITTIGIGVGLGLNVSVALLGVIPMTIVFMALGTIPMGVGAVIILLSGFILAFSWFQNR